MSNSKGYGILKFFVNLITIYFAVYK